MAHTYSIDHLVTSTEAVNVEVAAKTEMVKLSTSKLPNGRDGVNTVYGLGSGLNNYPATVVYTVENQVRRGEPVRRLTMMFTTWAADDDGVDDVIRKQISAEISFVIPADMNIELADFDDLVGNAISFLYPSVSSGTRSTSYLQKLLFGGPEVV